MFDLSKEYGLVLEGGGAKGAYQIGVWKALRECGVKIKGVAGVSVGALNGALICMGNYEKAVEIWENIRYSHIMKVDDDDMGKLMAGDFFNLDLKRVTRNSAKVLAMGGFDITPLRKLIDESIDEEAIRNSDIEFIMGTFLVNSMKEIEISSKEAKPGYLKDYLMASSYLPVFKNEKLHGKTYLDGGMVNNVPIDMLINRGYKNIIVVRIYGIGLERRVKIPDDVNVIEIAPTENLCSILEFDQKKSARNITLGYLDAMKTMKKLCGRGYYVETKEDEEYYLKQFMKLVPNELEEYKLIKPDSQATDYRLIYEEILPKLAESLKLNRGWTYKELYIGILERLAKELHIRRLNIYAEEEWTKIMQSRVEKMEYINHKRNPFVAVALQIIENQDCSHI